MNKQHNPSTSRRRVVSPANRPSMAAPGPKARVASPAPSPIPTTPVLTAAERMAKAQAELAAAQAEVEREQREAEEIARAAREAEEIARSRDAVRTAAQKNPAVLAELQKVGLGLEDLERFELLMSARDRVKIAAAVERIQNVEDDSDSPETDYDGADTPRKLQEILQLADSLGVITAQDVVDHVKQPDGRKWTPNPARKQLDKLVRRGQLVMRTEHARRATKRGVVIPRTRYLYARDPALLDRYFEHQTNQA